MYLHVNGHKTYCYTGGKAWDANQPSIVFIHGVLNDHSVWILQTRYLAHHGWNVLVPDLPGHGKSAGVPPRSVEDAAHFVLALLDAAGVQRAALAGHSFGSLSVLQAAAQAPQRVSHLALVGTAYPMKVSPALLDAALHQPQQAIAMVNRFSHSTLAAPPSTLGPGTWLHGSSVALMRRMLASNTTVNVFHTGFQACDSYQGGESAMQQVHEAQIPVLFILGTQDQMTQPKMAQTLIAQAPHARVVRLNAGHALMGEAPDGVLQNLTNFLIA